MTVLIIRRLLIGILVLLIISVIIFLATQTLPGDAAQAILGRQATPERLAALRTQLHLDQPALLQYLSWLHGVVTLDFGNSLANGGAVVDVIGPLFRNSVVLMLAAAIIGTPIALLLGAWSALQRDRVADHAVAFFTLVFAAVPEFVVGMILVIVFATGVLNWLPAVYVGTGPAWSQPSQLVLPAITLALSVGPYIVRSMRATMLEVLESQYVQQARLKGVREHVVLLRHGLPNALGPVVQVVALQLAYMMGGAVVVEFLFRYPGIGNALVDAVANRDLPVIQFLTLIIAAITVGVNLLADAIGLIANPKVRTAGK